jgi:phosphatidylglycerol:prolipoprotein diacylglycerol transferase
MIELFRSLFTPPRHLILLVAAVWLGQSLAEKRVSRYKVSPEVLGNLIFYGLIAFILGGRLYYALSHLTAFIKSPLSLFDIGVSLFDPLGGSVAALLTMLVYGRRQKLELWNTLDALTPFLAILAIALGLSHLAAGIPFGKPTSLPWAIHLWNEDRHPIQIYESVAALLTFGLVWTLKPNPRPGLLFLTFAALTAGWQLFVGAYRGDGTLLPGGFHMEQIIAWAVLAASLGLYEWRQRQAVMSNPGDILS